MCVQLIKNGKILKVDLSLITYADLKSFYKQGYVVLEYGTIKHI